MAKFKILPECPATPSTFSNNGVGTVVEMSSTAAETPLKNKWIKKVGDTQSASSPISKKTRTRKPAATKVAKNAGATSEAGTNAEETKD